MTIRDILKQIIHDEFVEMYGVPCTVKAGSYDDVNKTVVCSPVNGDADFIDVKLQADPGNGILVKPKDGSFVIIQPTNIATGYVAMFSQVDSIQFLDGSYGGLTKTQELKDELDKTNDVLQAVVDSLKNWTVAPNDGGAALKTFFVGLLGTKTKGSFTNIENTKVTHGNI